MTAARRLALLLALTVAPAGCSSDGRTGAASTPAAPDAAAPPTPAACSDDRSQAAPRLRRLTRYELDNTVADLLGVGPGFGAGLPPDDQVEGFDNNVDALRVGPLLADKLLAAAEDAAASAMQRPAALDPCLARDAPDAGCAAQAIARLARRAFRRPATTDDVSRYLSLHLAIAAEEGFGEGMKAAIAALLQSPSFLYRSELGGAPVGDQVALTDHEIASELSYLFWSTMPDDELAAAADAGALHTPAQIAAQARRLLASPRSRATLDHFASQWLAIDQVLVVAKDDAATPDFTPAIRAAMRAESLDLFDHVVRAGSGRLPELFSTHDSFLSPELARYYGLEGAPVEQLPGGVGRWDVSAAHRGGILTHGAILASQAKPLRPSPVLRGKLVREQLLCSPLAAPPAGLNVELAPVDPNLPNRQRYAEHAANPVCASCHHLIDPIGFGFERYDSIGRYAAASAGQPIDDSGEVLDSPHTAGKFQGLLDLEQRLASSPDVSACFARQWVRFGYGDDENGDLACVLAKATATFQQSGLSIADLLVALTQAPEFRLRVVRPPVGPQN